jgi:hypothetical protein
MKFVRHFILLKKVPYTKYKFSYKCVFLSTSPIFRSVWQSLGSTLLLWWDSSLTGLR